MNSITEKIQPPPRKNKLANRWILLVLLAFLPLIATGVASAHRSDAPTLGLALSAGGTATPTSTVTPTATQNKWLPPIEERTVKVSGDTADLRSGPDNNFEVVRHLTFGDVLTLLGRLSDNTWLYVKTSDGKEGWINTIFIDLAGVDLDYHPIATPSPLQITTVKVIAGTVNIRTGPSYNFSKVQQLTFGAPLILLGRLSDNTWLYVKTSYGHEGWIDTRLVNLAGVNLDDDNFLVATSPPTETSTPVILPGIEGRWIDIDLSEQMLYANDGAIRVASFLVSTGVPQFPTEVGQYHIYAKFLFSDMRGEDYFLPDVPFNMFYSGDFSIHGTYWHHNFGTPMSHGCVNMDIIDAEWLFNWAEVGTLVNIHR